MGLYDRFKTSSEMETAGVVVDYGDFRVTMARAGGRNAVYQTELERRLRPHRKAIAAGIFPNEALRGVLRQVLAKCCVKNWETKTADGWSVGIEGPDGALLPFSEENILRTFEALPDLFEAIQADADSAAFYREALREAASGNL